MAPADPVEEWLAPVGRQPYITGRKQKAVRSTSVVLRTASEF